ncbi:flagellar biosynthesis protein FlhB [Hahella chejuensis]|uniref:flagellar biosynthesis protein FlhB n=1 Tax=Hahella chejuensis TaxID=158327 RepID=UPI000324E006|nr:flagellar biosynthesis protein FlhB [Hahella chejuensis]
MAESQPDKSEKTEPPSPFKLQEAKKKGSVAKSQEVSHVFALAAGALLLWSVSQDLATRFFSLCQKLFADAASVDFDIITAKAWGIWIVSEVSWILSPLLVVMMVIGVLCSIVQTGPVFSFHPIKPDIKRINPITGFKRLFSIKILFELVKNLIKLALLGSVLYWALAGLMPDLFGLTAKSAATALPVFIGYAAGIIFKLTAALLLIALIDMLFTRWEFMRNMRMTKKEVKDEIKRREGDPHIRAKRKELERELRKRSGSAASVPEADLIITNPEHYAVVVKYDAKKMAAPTVTGKGGDAMAKHLRDLARQHQVPIIQDPPLARYLFKKTEIGSMIPEDAFVGVARALRRAYQIKRERQGRDQFSMKGAAT